MQGHKTQAIAPGDSVEYGCASSPYCGNVGTVLSVEDQKEKRHAVVDFGAGVVLTVYVKQLTWVPRDVEAIKARMRSDHLAAMREPLDSMLYEDDWL